MTAYTSFVQDFPSRCKRILESFWPKATNNNLEVTLLLNIASASLVIPYERLQLNRDELEWTRDGENCPSCGHELRPATQVKDIHPSSDAIRFRDARAKMLEMLKKPLLASDLLNSDGSTWRFEEKLQVEGDPDRWGLDKLKALGSTTTTKRLMKVLRNALAHGNIFTMGNPISLLVFLSRSVLNEPELGYDCITVSPEDFRRFILNWLDVLAQLDIPEALSPEIALFDEYVA